jgi:hypothetical protein
MPRNLAAPSVSRRRRHPACVGAAAGGRGRRCGAATQPALWRRAAQRRVNKDVRRERSRGAGTAPNRRSESESDRESSRFDVIRDELESGRVSGCCYFLRQSRGVWRPGRAVSKSGRMFWVLPSLGRHCRVQVDPEEPGWNCST